MNAQYLAGLPLRLRLFLRRLGAPAVLAALFWVAGAAGWIWVWRQDPPPPFQPVPAPSLAVAPAAGAADHLALFYAALGDPRYAEQQVKTLFDLAARNGLNLEQGEYKISHDQAGRLSTYQVLLPVKGTYAAIWQFALQVLRAVPFASLDEISFRRDSIAQPVLEAHLRLSFYLAKPVPVLVEQP